MSISPPTTLPLSDRKIAIPPLHWTIQVSAPYPDRIREMVEDLEKKMKQAAKKLEFEEAALLRDEIRALEEKELEMQ